MNTLCLPLTPSVRDNILKMTTLLCNILYRFNRKDYSINSPNNRFRFHIRATIKFGYSPFKSNTLANPIHVPLCTFLFHMSQSEFACKWTVKVNLSFDFLICLYIRDGGGSFLSFSICFPSLSLTFGKHFIRHSLEYKYMPTVVWGWKLETYISFFTNETYICKLNFPCLPLICVCMCGTFTVANQSASEMPQFTKWFAYNQQLLLQHTPATVC